MARVTVEDCLQRLDNRFALVLLVARRAKLLAKGAAPTVQNRDNKYVVTALREVAMGRVHFEEDSMELKRIAEAELIR